MPSSKLQNVIIRTMRSDLEFLGSRGASAVIEKSPDQAEEILRRAQSAIRQAETERGVARSAPKQKITEGPSTPPEQDLNVLQEKVQQKTEAERKRQEEEARLEAERKRQEEEARLEVEKKRWEKILSEAETTAQSWNIFGDLEDAEKNSELLALKEQKIESIQLELKNFPVQEKSILPNKKNAFDRKKQLEEEYQKLLSRLNEVKQSRENIEQLEEKARSGKERRRYEEKRWQLANRQRAIEQEKWNKKDELAEVSATLNKMEEQFSGLEAQKEQLTAKLQELDFERQEILMKQEKNQIRQKLIELSLSKDKPVRLIEKLENQKDELRSELRPILADERRIEGKELELKKKIENAVDDNQKRILTEERWQVEKEREKIEKNRWQIEQKAILLRDQHRQASAPYQDILNKEKELYQRLRDIDVLIAYGIERGQKKLDERAKKIKEIRTLKSPQAINFSDKTSDKAIYPPDQSTPPSTPKIKLEEGPKKHPPKIEEKEDAEIPFEEPKIPGPAPKIVSKRPTEHSVSDELEEKKKIARQALEEEMIERRKAMEQKQAEIEKERQAVVSPPLEQKPEQKESLSTSMPDPEKPKNSREAFMDNLMASASQEEIEREKFLKRVRGEEELPAPPREGATTQEGVIFRPVPQSPDKGHKIISRVLIVLLIIGLGVVAYLILRGYLL